MIIKSKSVSMAESLKYLQGSDKEKELKSFIQKFTKRTPESAEKLRKALEELDILILNSEDISKIIDISPKTPEELIKTITGKSLEEDETKKILETIQKTK